MNKNQQIDLTQGPIIRQLLKFFFPILLGMLFNQLYNTVDAIIVGKFVGTDALAAVGGSPAAIINLVIGFFNGLATGATVIISQYCGANDDYRLSRTVHTIILFSVLMGVVISVGGYLSAEGALRLIKTPADIMDMSTEYMHIYYLGAIPLLLYNVGSGILRAMGDSRRPLYYLIVCCGLNIVLDTLFVALLKWGVAGVAWATLISLTVSAFLTLRCLARAKGAERLQFRKLCLDGQALSKTMYIGIPSALSGMMYTVSNLILQSCVNDFGTSVVAAWTAAGKIDGVFWVTSNSLGTALCAMAGQCFGAGKYDRMKTSVKKWLLVSFSTALAMSLMILVASPAVVKIFTDDVSVMDETVQILKYFVPFYPVWIFIEIFSSAVRGAGDSVRPMIISILGICVLRILWVFLVVPRWHTIMCVSFSYCFTWVITATVTALYYFKSDWLQRCIKRKN